MALLNYIADNWISIVALSISLLLLYRDYFQPFRLSVRAVGRITISKNPWSEGLQQDCIHIDLVFSNQGAKRGVVEDVALELWSGEIRAFFRSLAIIRDRSLNLGKELLPPALETFIGFELSKTDSTVRRVLLVPHDNSPTSYLQALAYEGKIWIKHSRSKKWIEGPIFAFNVEKEDLEELAKTTIVPQPDGRYYVNWITRDKVLDKTANELDELLNDRVIR